MTCAYIQFCVCICSVDDDTFLQYTKAVNEDFVSQDFLSQKYDTSFHDENLDMEDEGFVENSKGRTANYSNTKNVDMYDTEASLS